MSRVWTLLRSIKESNREKYKELIRGKLRGKYINEYVSQHMPGYKFYKLLNDTGCHRGFQYHEGLNIDTNEWQSPIPNCMVCCGLYFAESSSVLEYLSYDMTYMCEVMIPDGACIKSFRNSFNVDKLILGPKQLIRDAEFWNGMGEKYFMQMTLSNKFSVKHLPDRLRTDFIIREAVSRNPKNIFDIPQNKLTPELNNLAMSQFIRRVRSMGMSSIGLVSFIYHFFREIPKDFINDETYLDIIGCLRMCMRQLPKWTMITINPIGILERFGTCIPDKIKEMESWKNFEKDVISLNHGR